MAELVMADEDLPNGNLNSSTLPRSAKRCRIPRLNRSTSVRLRNERPEGLRPESRPKSMTLSTHPWQLEGCEGDLQGSVNSMPFSVDDNSSVKSFGSFVSYGSFASHSQGTAESRPISRTHYGKKYVLHCDRHLAKQEEYLTPTQRKDREIRQLKSALLRQTRACEEKDTEIQRQKDELRRLQDALSELQVCKDSLMNSSQESDSLNAKNSSEISFESNESDVRVAAATCHDDSGISNVLSTSLSPRNSSEFDDVQHHAGLRVLTADKAVSTDSDTFEDCFQPRYSGETPIRKSGASECYQKDCSRSSEAAAPPQLSLEFDRFLGAYKKELEELKSQHKEHYQDLKERFDEKVDDLLRKLTEANTRYLELRPLFDRAQDKIQSIESQLSEVQKEIETQDDYHNQMYLKMYRKGQEAARFRQAEDSLDYGQVHHSKDLLRQLHQLEAELDQTKALYSEAARGMGDRQAEYTLRFLKDAVFYFLTKKDKEHLKAIQSILGFTDAERMAVAKAMKHRRLFCSPFKLKK